MIDLAFAAFVSTAELWHVEAPPNAFRFAVPGRPVPQGRGVASSRRTGRRGLLVVDPPESRAFKARVRHYATAEAARRSLALPVFSHGPVAIVLRLIFDRPKSRPGRSRVPMTRTPDIENLAKAILDGASFALYRDDAQVTLLWAEQWEAALDEDPRAEVIAWPFAPPEEG